MLRTWVYFLVVMAALYLAACLVLFVFQRSLIYFPQPRAETVPATLLKLSVDGVEVLVSSRPHAGPKALIYFGGNAEDATYNLPSFALAFPDHAIYLLHYRGFGGSAGAPSEAAIQRDAQALFDQVYASHREVTLVGRSLGSGVAVHLASERPAARLVLVTPYSSVLELAQQQFPYFPVRWLLRDRFESWRYATHIRVPTLLIAAEHDEVIPRASTERLYRHFATGVATLRVIPDVGHNSISESPQYLKLLGEGL
ncbi:alpha/beta hydrolase [Pseudomonas sp. UL073]|uniref:Alpha/beta hydrolase n=1 Tax=Zestomonas insulae TaxID=2809017 RepID=A0ABS2II91_9GAMM|nr:alpha/beta fold hydrolase [Pseudomonas insulae]MBM7061883.1 alpha/beta hydrolase [Pseudomonas insulae]